MIRFQLDTVLAGVGGDDHGLAGGLSGHQCGLCIGAQGDRRAGDEIDLVIRQTLHQLHFAVGASVFDFRLAVVGVCQRNSAVGGLGCSHQLNGGNAGPSDGRQIDQTRIADIRDAGQIVLRIDGQAGAGIVRVRNGADVPSAGFQHSQFHFIGGGIEIRNGRLPAAEETEAGRIAGVPICVDGRNAPGAVNQLGELQIGVIRVVKRDADLSTRADADGNLPAGIAAHRGHDRRRGHLAIGGLLGVEKISAARIAVGDVDISAGINGDRAVAGADGGHHCPRFQRLQTQAAGRLNSPAYFSAGDFFPLAIAALHRFLLDRPGVATRTPLREPWSLSVWKISRLTGTNLDREIRCVTCAGRGGCRGYRRKN